MGFAMRTGEPLIGLFASALMVPTGTATIRVRQRRRGGPPLALLLNATSTASWGDQTGIVISTGMICDLRDDFPTQIVGPSGGQLSRKFGKP